MIWTDETYRIHGMTPGNPAAGSSEHIARSLACYDLIDRPIIELAFRDCAERGKSYDLEFPLTRIDGRRVWIQTMARPVMEGDRVVKVMGNILDITERKQAEKTLRNALQEWSASFDAMSDGVSIHDVDHKILKVNRTLCQMLGRSAEELIGRKCYEIFHGTNHPTASCPIEVTRRTGKGANAEFFDTTLNKWLSVSSSPVFDDLGQLINLVHIVRDITEGKQADEALLESETKLQAIFDTVGTGILIIDKETQVITDANQTAIEMTGLPKESIIGQICHSVVCPAQTGKCPVKDLDHTVDHSERKLLCLDGHQKDILKTVYPITLNGRECYVESFIDISARLRAEEGLRQEKEWSDNLIKSAPNIVVGLGEKSKIHLFNGFAESLTGYKAAEVIGKSWIDLFVPAQIREQIYLVWDDIVKTKAIGHHYENMIVLKNGQQRLIEWNNKVISENGLFKMVLSIGKDITDRTQAENALKEERQRLANIIKGTNIGTWEWNVQTGETIFNDRWAEIIGYTLDEISPISIETWMKFTHPDDLEISGKLLEKHFHGEIDYYEFESRMKHKDGSWVWVLDRGQVATWTEDEKPLMMMGTHQDITFQKRTEERLLKSEEKFSKAFKMAPLLMTISSIEDGTYLDVNEKFIEVSGFERNEAIGKTSVGLGWLNPKDRELLIRELKRKGSVEGMELELETKDKKKVFCLFYGEIINIGGQQRLLSIAQDISERKRSEDELISANIKLESLWNVTSLSNTDTKTVSDHILESITRMTQSEYGFYGFINNDESVMTIHSWSGEAMKDCSLVDKPQHFPIDEAGVWAVAVRSREPLILNDYRIAHEGKKGLPAGHVELTNLMVVPFFTQDRITAVAAVANRRTAYSQDDVIHVTTFLNSVKAAVDGKRADDMVRESQRQLTDIIEFLPDAILAIDNDKRIIIWNRAIEEMSGIPAQEMIGKGDYAYSIPFYGEARPQLMDLVLSDNEEISTKYKQIHRQGDTFVAEAFCNALYNNKGAWVYAKAAPLRDQKGNIKGVIEIIRDITEQKHYEDALKDYQRNLADVINFLPDATFVIDKDGIVTAWNNAMASMTGIKAEEMIGKGNYEYAIPFYGERRPIIIDLILSENEEFLRKSYDAINCQEAVLSGEVYVPEIFGGKGAYLWGNASRLYNASGEVIGAIQSIRDITERRKAEEEKRGLEDRLNRAEKMESLGTLAGGVAHDLNNVLGIVVGYAEMLMDGLDEANPMRNDLEKILEGGNRSAAIVQDLLTLARRGVQTKKTVNLNAAVMDCQKLPEFEKIVFNNRQVKLQADLESDLLNIIGSPVHLAKSIINLVANAVEAMPNGGVLKIATANQYLDVPIHGYDKIREGDYVVLTVSDTGEGIPERDIKRIFEPFYTKKIMGRSGTGLGLAVVWGTIKDHNGYIDVESAEGKGTTFTLYFPVTREEITSDQVCVSMSEYMGRGETILVVDDIKGQRELAARMLTKLNYIVSTVASGEEAIEYLKSNKADLIVLDMIMDPGIDGLETYENILKLNHLQKAVIVSGFSESDRVKEAQKIGAGAYVPKPYVLERLGMAVRKELDRK
ncbi:MAG TPA: hypothetical protein DCG53_00340 [Syntrophus sp. (in: bacteria)]|nr:hypothetical protein [Syntrophus sp. (in: bacteria)]